MLYPCYTIKADVSRAWKALTLWLLCLDNLQARIEVRSLMQTFYEHSSICLVQHLMWSKSLVLKVKQHLALRTYLKILEKLKMTFLSHWTFLPLSITYWESRVFYSKFLFHKSFLSQNTSPGKQKTENLFCSNWSVINANMDSHVRTPFSNFI